MIETRTRIVEATLVLFVFVIGASTAYAFLSKAGARTLTEWESTPAVMLACGQGLRQPVQAGPILAEFEQRLRPTISCADMRTAVSTAAFPVTLSERYQLYGAALALRIGGTSWVTLDAFLAVLYGVSMTCAFGIFRLFAGRIAALLGTIALCFSAQLLGLLTLRDYGKAPSFYAVWLALGWLMASSRCGVDRKTLWRASILGLVTGIGLGFRADILVAVPACAAVIVTLPGFRRDALKWKGAALAAYLATFALVSSPILLTMSGGSNNAHVIALGLMTPFNASLGLEPAPYDIGATYSDGYAFTLVASHATVVRHEPQPVAFSTPRYDQLGAGLLGDLARQFPADLMIRTAGAVVQALRYPFDSAHRATELDSPVFAELPRVRSLAEMVGAVLGAFEGHALWLTLGMFLLMLVRDRRQALVCGLLVAYFCGYAMLQFSRRHTFHLDLVPVAVVVALTDAVLLLVPRLLARRRARAASSDHPRFARRRATQGLVAIAAVIVVWVLSMTSVRVWQQRHVEGLIDRTLGARWETVVTGSEPLTDTNEPAYSSAPALWGAATLKRVPPPPASALSVAESDSLETSYFSAEVGGPGCARSNVHLATAYSGSEHTAHREYSRTFQVPTSADAATVVLVPAFYQYGTFWTRFDGFATPNEEASCVGTIKRVASIGDVPLPILTAVLTPDWRARPLYQVLSSTVLELPVRDSRNFQSLPEPLTWTLGPAVERTKTFWGSTAFAGDATASGYQTTSPVVDQPPGTRVVVRVAVRQQKGHVCVGALDRTAATWIAAPTSTGLDFTFDVDRSGGFIVAITNCNARADAAPSRFTVGRAEYAVDAVVP